MKSTLSILNTGHWSTARVRGLSIAIVALLGLSMAPAARADVAPARVPLTLGPGSTLWLDGKSTLHDFESKTSQTSITLLRDAAAPAPTNASELDAMIRGAGVRGLELDVPVLSLRSEKSGLDKNLWKALKADKYPKIRFRLSHYAVVGPATADTLPMRGEGSLEVAGTTRPDTLDARVYRTPQGVWLTGSEPLRMSTFGITPPKMMMGTLKVDDRIVVHYRLLLAPKDGAQANSSGTN